MARPLRIEFKGAYYHVMNRGHRKFDIFEDISDYREFIKLMKELVEIYQVRIIAYCLMPNHYHLFLHTPFGHLSRPMRHLNGIYTQRFNRKYHLDGPLFKGRYKSIIVDSEHYYLELIRYIHRNPIRSGFESKLGGYPWSSHQAYLNINRKNDWIFNNEALARFGFDRMQQLKAYIKYVSDDDSEDILQQLDRKKWHQTLSSESFRLKFKKQHLQDKINPEQPQSRNFMWEIDEIKDIVASQLNVTKTSLETGRRGQVNEARDIAIYLSRQYSGKGHLEVAKMFGGKRSTMVGSTIHRVKKQLDNNQAFKAKIQDLRKLLKTQNKT